MKRFLSAVLVVAACGAEPRDPTVPSNDVAVAAGGPTGEARLALGGDFPDLAFPLTVTHAAGSAEILDGKEHVLTVPAHDHELTRIGIEGWRPVWVRVPVGGAVRLSAHPCCGITFDSNTYDDAIARCTEGGGADCPAGTVRVPHSLAVDPVCGERERCVPHTRLRVVQTRPGGAEAVVDEHGEVWRAVRDADAPAELVDPNIADMFSFTVDGPASRQDIGMDRGVTYTIFLDGTQVMRVRADDR